MINLLYREGRQYDENFMGTNVMGFRKAKIRNDWRLCRICKIFVRIFSKSGAIFSYSASLKNSSELTGRVMLYSPSRLY